MIRSRHWMLAASAGLLFAGHALAVPSAQFELFRTSLTDTSVTYDVRVEFVDEPDGSALSFIQLDVAASSPELFTGGDFSRFTFTPGTALANWTEFLFDTPGFGLNDSLVAYDTFTDTDMLLEGTHLLGSLSVDLTGVPGGNYTVRLAAPNALGGTDAGQEVVPGQGPFELISSFPFGVDTSDAVDSFDVRPTQPPTPTPGVPEPGTVLLGVLAAGALGLRRKRTANAGEF